MIPDIEVSVMHQSLEVKPDADGEERILVSDVVLELDMKFFREEEYSLVTVSYCCNIKHKQFLLFTFIGKGKMKFWKNFWCGISPDAGSLTAFR